MSLTLSDIRGLVQENIHNDTSISNARINSWINLAQDDVESKVLKRYLRTKSNIATEVDISEYTIIESNFRSFIQFWQTDTPSKLSRYDYEDFVLEEPDPTSTGKPLIWIFLGFTSGFPTVMFFPIPDAAYSINYEFYANLSDLSSDSDVSLISEMGWANLLVLGATKRYHQIMAPDDYLVWDREFEKELRKFNEQMRQYSSVGRMKQSFAEDLPVETLFRIPETVSS